MRKLIFISLVLVVIAIGLLHFFTPGHLIFYHDTYRRLSYFPIVLGAVLYGVWGGIGLAVMTSIAFIPHLLIFMGNEPETYLSELTEIILYLAAGAGIGFIAGRQVRLREKYKLLSEKLGRSYDRLHEETELLIEVEEQLSASQKLSALGQLSASLAHEIKNPLSSIKGTAEILLDEFPEGHPKREFVEILQKEAARLNITVDEVLQYSRNKTDETEAVEPLSHVIARVCKLLENQLKHKSINFEISGSSIADNFLISGGKLSQVFLNIILNAIDAAPDGGRIMVSMGRDAEGISVLISDNGPGIPVFERERVFQPFISDKEDGTGLGLSISRKIVTGYGGRITVSDAEGGGACFTVFLPHKTIAFSPKPMNSGNAIIS